MKIIVAMDLAEGRCARLTRGDYSTKRIYSEDPLGFARKAESNGIKCLHIVDLDGARSRKVTSYGILEKIAAATGLEIDFGGGIRSRDDICRAFECGAARVVSGSIAVTEPELFSEWLEEFGNDRIILAADCKGRQVVIQGWTEQSVHDVVDFIDLYRTKGVRHIICTDAARDGMLAGPSLDLYKEILAGQKIELIASGGISSLHDIEELSEAGCSGAIVGKALYEGIITLEELGKLC